MTEMMRRVCSYCKLDMGEKPDPAGMTTHGICPECAVRWKAADEIASLIMACPNERPEYMKGLADAMKRIKPPDAAVPAVEPAPLPRPAQILWQA